MLEIKKKIVIGGEKTSTPFKCFSSAKNDIFFAYENAFAAFTINYTFGGYYSLLAIFDNLKKKQPEGKILLPSYLCSSILMALKTREIPYIFYNLDFNLTINIHDVEGKCKNNSISAIIIIDYLGRNQYPNISSYLSYFAEKKIKVIQDCVHSLCLGDYKIYGDYAFNSFRKILPYEGSLLISKEPLNINFTRGSNLKFLYHKRLGQFLRYCHLKYNLFRPGSFLSQFKKAERNYNGEKIYHLTKGQKALIRKIDINQLLSSSKTYFNILLNKYRTYTIEYFDDTDFYPLGFFLILNNRNVKIAELQQKEIYCPIHWNLPTEVKIEEFPESHRLSAKAATIPLVNMNDEQFKYLINCLESTLT